MYLGYHDFVLLSKTQHTRDESIILRYKIVHCVEYRDIVLRGEAQHTTDKVEYCSVKIQRCSCELQRNLQMCFVLMYYL